MFVGYPRRIKGGYFYNLKEGKILISTNATFLEENYIQDFKSRIKVMLEEMSNSIVTLVVHDVENVPINEERLIVQQTPRESRHSGRIVWQPDRFMSSGKALEAETIGHEDDCFTYNEAITNVLDCYFMLS